MFRAVACVISAGVLIQPAFLSQEFRSTIGGAVTDQQGAVLPSIEILAIQMDTGAKFRMVSAGDGEYTLPFVPPEFIAWKSGFSSEWSSSTFGITRSSMVRTQIPPAAHSAKSPVRRTTSAG